MNDADHTSPAEASQTVSDAIANARAEGHAQGIETAAAIVEETAEAAAARVAAAEAAAQAAADALAQTTLAQRIEALERANGEGGPWREMLALQQQTLQTMTNILTAVSSSLAMLVEAMTEPEMEMEEPSTPGNSSSATPGENPEVAESGGGPASPKSNGRRRLI